MQSLINRGGLPTPLAARTERNPGKTCEGSAGFRGNKSQRKTRFSAAGQESRALHNTRQRAPLCLSDSLSVEECVLGEQPLLALPFCCINYKAQGFNLQEEKHTLHLNSSRSLAEVGSGATLHCRPHASRKMRVCKSSRAGFAPLCSHGNSWVPDPWEVLSTIKSCLAAKLWPFLATCNT